MAWLQRAGPSLPWLLVDAPAARIRRQKQSAPRHGTRNG